MREGGGTAILQYDGSGYFGNMLWFAQMGRERELESGWPAAGVRSLFRSLAR